MTERGRIARFVRTARTLLLVQLAAALLAAIFALWAVVAVRDLAAERDRLRERVAELQTQSTTAAPLATETLGAGEPVAPMVLPVAIPIADPLPETNTILPEPTLPDANVAAAPPPQTEAPPELDCTGANANQARCRPGRWTRPVPRRPPAEAPPANAQQPPGEN